MGGTEGAQRYYDDFSTTYDRGRDRGYHALIDELELRAVMPYARGRVLEAGCGTGLLLAPIADVAQEAIGIDLSRGMLARARERGLSVVHASVTALPFPDASFDTVCSFKVLAHVPDFDRALGELVRVTKPGGHLVLEVYNRWSLRYAARLAAGARRIGRAHDESDIFTRWISPRALVGALPQNLSLVEAHGVRVFTPAARLHDVPLVGAALGALERRAACSPLRWFGGFLVLVLQRGW